MTPDNLLTVKEFADLIRVNPLTIYRRIWRGRQAGVCRFDRDIRIDAAVAIAHAKAAPRAANQPEQPPV